MVTLHWQMRGLLSHRPRAALQSRFGVALANWTFLATPVTRVRRQYSGSKRWVGLFCFGSGGRCVGSVVSRTDVKSARSWALVCRGRLTWVYAMCDARWSSHNICFLQSHSDLCKPCWPESYCDAQAEITVPSKCTAHHDTSAQVHRVYKTYSPAGAAGNLQAVCAVSMVHACASGQSLWLVC